MPDDAQQGHLSQLEHAMTTVFACLSMVKYNAIPGEEQKKELITDIEKTLQFLRGGLIASTSVDARGTIPQVPSTGSLSTPPLAYAEMGQHIDQHALQALYQTFHSYLSMDQENTSSPLFTRFNEIMTTIDEVQNKVERPSDIAAIHQYEVSIENPLHRVRGFIADLYYMFVEFLRALSHALHENNIHVDTEELSVLQKQLAESTGEYQAPGKMQDLSPVFSIYEMHQRFSKQRGDIDQEVRRAIAFLEFLEESLDTNISQRHEVVAQINKIAQLLSDLHHLLANYENAISLLLRAR